MSKLPGASSVVAQFQANVTKDKLFNLFKSRTKNYSWSFVDSSKVDLCTDEELRQYHIPMPSEFDSGKRFRRNLYLVCTLNGALVNWFYFFQPLILVSFTGVFIVIFSNTVQLNGRREFDTKTETLVRFEMDMKFLFDMILVCIFGIVLTYAVPHDLTVAINESSANRHRRQQFLNLMTRLLRYDPFADLHDMDYNSNVDPVCAYLWFLYYNLSVNLCRDYLFEKSNNNNVHLHSEDCDCIRDMDGQELRELSGLGYDGVLQCTQKIDIVIDVVKVLRSEFPEKHTQDEEDELVENLVLMAIQSYTDVLKVTERGMCGSVIHCIKRFSIQPPRGQGAYSKSN
jgi:hypothetical protein